LTSSDLQVLGERLRAAREKRALSLEEAERQTRIRAKFLEALESGDISVLPSATHAKGFLRNYAQFLGMDADAVVLEFARLTGGSAMPSPTAAYPPTQPPSPPPAASRPPDRADRATRRSGTITPAQRSGPGVPLGIARPAQPRPDQPEPPARQRFVVGQLIRSWYFTAAVLLVGVVAVVWWATTRLGNISGQDLLPLTEQAGAAQTPGTPVFRPTPTFLLTSTTSPTNQAQLFDRVVLSIAVEQATWMRVKVDGTVAFEGLANPGEVLFYEGRSEVYVLTGNAAGLDVTYNGQEIGPLGDYGQVAERFFTASGQATPTPTPTITPTSTSVPSPTPSRTPGP
jgi:transcriptional regulator with XRE-family HTH domain